MIGAPCRVCPHAGQATEWPSHRMAKPQSGQATKGIRRKPMSMNAEPFQIPPEMRAFAEKSVEQARKAFDSVMSAAHHTVSTFEGQAHAARKGAKDISDKAMDFAEQNIASSFDFAQKLLRAKDIKEMLELQGTYV